MSLRDINCKQCNTSFLAFPEEAERMICPSCHNTLDLCILPPLPVVVHATSRIMVDYLLDSIYTIHQSTSELIHQKADEREYKQYQKALTR
jgi:hypothetical protein